MSEDIGYKSYCKNKICGIHGYLFWDQMDSQQKYWHDKEEMIGKFVRCKACREHSSQIREIMDKEDAFKKNQIRHRHSSMDAQASIHGH